jgi:hypothetical protein
MIFVDRTIIPEFDVNRKTLAIGIENPLVKRDFMYALRQSGYFYDGNLTHARIEMPVYVFIAVMCRYDDRIYQHFRETTNRCLKEQGAFETPYKAGLPLPDKVAAIMKTAGLPIGTLSDIGSLLGLLS